MGSIYDTGELKKKIVMTISITACFIYFQKGYAQLASKAQEFWPSLDLYYRLNQKSRLYATATGTRMDQTYYADGAIGIFFDYFPIQPSINQKLRRNHIDSLPGRFFWVRGGYQYSTTPPSAEDPFKENTFVTEANSRFYLPAAILLTIKNRFDWRSRNENFNVRFRPRLTFEKEFHTDYLFFTGYTNFEYFINFNNKNVNRFRIQTGVEIKVTKIINYEVFWNHQFANPTEISQLNAFGMALKFYLTHGSKKQKKQPQTSFIKIDPGIFSLP
jgi:hypothetical protein